jgi:hypothetical protein
MFSLVLVLDPAINDHGMSMLLIQSRVFNRQLKLNRTTMGWACNAVRSRPPDSTMHQLVFCIFFGSFTVVASGVESVVED